MHINAICEIMFGFNCTYLELKPVMAVTMPYKELKLKMLAIASRSLRFQSYLSGIGNVQRFYKTKAPEKSKAFVLDSYRIRQLFCDLFDRIGYLSGLYGRRVFYSYDILPE